MMDDLMMHVLDLAMNSVAAGARTVWIRVAEDPAEDRLVLRVVDNGCGMSPGLLAAARDRFATTKGGRSRPIGLGLALLRQTAEMCNGALTVLSRPREGTLVEAWMQRSHIDRPPVGDCAATLFDLVVGNPAVGFRFTRCVGGEGYTFDSRAVRRMLGGAEGLQRPEGMRRVRDELERGERGLTTQRERVQGEKVQGSRV